MGGCDNLSTQELSTVTFATSAITLYDGPNLTNISLAPGDGLNEVIVAIDDALGNLVDVNVDITATVTEIVGDNLKVILESIDNEFTTINTSITNINTAIGDLGTDDIAYDGATIDNYTVTGATKLTGHIEGIDDEFGLIKADISGNFYTKLEINFRWDEHFKNWVFLNGNHENESGLSIDIEANSTYYVSGIRYNFMTPATQVLTASKENYVYITTAGAYAIQVEPLGGGTPAVAGMIIWFFLTDATSITAKTDLRLLDPIDGELICDNTINTTALKDFVLTSPASGDILQWDGTDFVNVPVLGNILPAGLADDDLILFNQTLGVWEKQPGSALDDWYIPITGTTGSNDVTGTIQVDTTAYNDIISDSNSLALIQFDGSNGIQLSDDNGSFGATASFLKLETDLVTLSSRGGSIELNGSDGVIDIFIKRLSDQAESQVFSSADNDAAPINGGLGNKFPGIICADNGVIDTGVINSVIVGGKYTGFPFLGEDNTLRCQHIYIEGRQKYTPKITTGPGAIDPQFAMHEIITTGTDALTLADPASIADGNVLMIYMKTFGGNGTLTPTNFHDGTTITFTAVNQVIWLLFQNAAWTFLFNKGTTIA